MRRSYFNSYPSDSSSGVAILIVIFIVALCSILVLNLTYSTFLNSRSVGMVERQLQAEYALKSLLNLSRALLAADPSSNEDSRKDSWGIFVDGAPVPPALLGISDPGVEIYLEINGEESGLPIEALRPGSSVSGSDQAWRKAFIKLFERLGFDKQLADKDQTGLFSGRVFDSKEMISNLIDYFDADTDSFSGDGTLPPGIESQLPEDTFPKIPKAINNLNELSIIPGFTARRIRAMAPYISFRGRRYVNINLASELVLECLHDSISPDKASEIVSRARSDQPFEQPSQAISELGLDNEVSSLITTDSTWFRVIGKVEYNSQGSYFLRASLQTDSSTPGELPTVRYPELF